jgi:hypothetical protein
MRLPHRRNRAARILCPRPQKEFLMRPGCLSASACFPCYSVPEQCSRRPLPRAASASPTRLLGRGALLDRLDSPASTISPPQNQVCIPWPPPRLSDKPPSRRRPRRLRRQELHLTTPVAFEWQGINEVDSIGRATACASLLCPRAIPAPAPPIANHRRPPPSVRILSTSTPAQSTPRHLRFPPLPDGQNVAYSVATKVTFSVRRS